MYSVSVRPHVPWQTIGGLIALCSEAVVEAAVQVHGG
jgi:hypothetical protein